MATTYFRGKSKRQKRSIEQTVKDCIDYSTNPTKTKNFKYITINNMGVERKVSSKEDIEQFEKSINQHHDLYKLILQRGVDEHPKTNLAKPFVMMTIRQSFLTEECSAEVAHQAGIELAKRVLGNNFKYVVSTHTNTQTVHNHIDFSPVDKDLKKYKSSKWEFLKIQKISDEICEDIGLTVVIKSKKKRSKIYSKSKGISFRKFLKEDIDNTIKSVSSFDEFIEKMKENYIVNTNRKHITFRHRTNGQKKNIRSYTLGKSYTEEMLKFRCNPTPQIKTNKKIKLRLVDIILLKGRKSYHQKTNNNISTNYYESKKNIFYLSNAINIVIENKIGSYSDLKDKIQYLNEQYNLLNNQIENIDENIEDINKIIVNLETYNKYKYVDDEYQNSILKKTFHKEHKDELDKFNDACLFLCAKNVDVTLDTNIYLSRLSEICNKKENFKDQLKEISKSLNQIVNTKKTIDNLYYKNDYQEHNNKIIKEKKFIVCR